jgi:hypothetical protein
MLCNEDTTKTADVVMVHTDARKRKTCAFNFGQHRG